MKKYGLASFLFLLFLAIALTFACGSPAVSHVSPSCNSAPTAANDSMPESITVCPAIAEAQDYPDGQVQFIAVGSFQNSPSPALLKPQVWGACQENSPTTAVSISNLGLAQCESGHPAHIAYLRPT